MTSSRADWPAYSIWLIYDEDLQETSRCQSADQTCNWCLTRPQLFILSHIIHSLGSHNYNIIRQFKSQFINSTLHNTQRKALLQHLMSISLCQMDHVWYIHLKETVVAASECSIEELRPRQSPVPAYLLTTSTSAPKSSIRRFVITEKAPTTVSQREIGSATQLS